MTIFASQGLLISTTYEPLAYHAYKSRDLFSSSDLLFFFQAEKWKKMAASVDNDIDKFKNVLMPSVFD